MKFTSSSTARRRTAMAPLRSFGGPQMPSPVRRIAPKPRRCTESSLPNETSPANLAETSFLFTLTSRIVRFTFHGVHARVPILKLIAGHGTLWKWTSWAAHPNAGTTDGTTNLAHLQEYARMPEFQLLSPSTIADCSPNHMGGSALAGTGEQHSHRSL